MEAEIHKKISEEDIYFEKRSSQRAGMVSRPFCKKGGTSEEAWRILKSSLGIFGCFRKVYISEHYLCSNRGEKGKILTVIY
jgi:hypothetical protein